MVSALEILYPHLQALQNGWMLIGSYSLKVQGLPLESLDIDIATSEAGAYILNDALKEYVVSGVQYKISDRFRSAFGKFIINGTCIEVMGNLQIERDGEWNNLEQIVLQRNVVPWHEMNIIVPSLRDQLHIYQLLNREKDGEKIDLIRSRIEELI